MQTGSLPAIISDELRNLRKSRAWPEELAETLRLVCHVATEAGYLTVARENIENGREMAATDFQQFVAALEILRDALRVFDRYLETHESRR